MIYLLDTNAAIALLKSFDAGSCSPRGGDRIAALCVGQFPIPLPPLPEQREICAFLDDRLSNIGKISEGIQKQIETLIAYRKSLIHECVTGQRRITEADLKRVTAYGSI